MLSHAPIARDYLSDLICDALMYRPGPTPIGQLAASVHPELRLSAELVENAAAQLPRFTQIERAYDLAYRSIITHKALSGALGDILRDYARPMPRPLATHELLLAGRSDKSTCCRFLDRMIATGRISQIADHFICLSEWLFTPMPGLEQQRVLYLNALENDQDLADVMEVCTDDKLGLRSLLDTAEAVLATAGRPLSNKALGFLVGCHQGDRYVPADLLRLMLTDDQGRFVPICGPRWILADWEPGLHETLRGQSTPSDAPDQAMDVAQVLAKDIPADKRYALSEDEIARITALAHASRAPISTQQVMSDVVELRPSQRKYTPAAQAVHHLLASQSSLRPLQGARFLRRAAIPQWVRTTPDTLVPGNWAPQMDRHGQLTGEDVLLRPEGIEPEALEAASDPYYDDVGEPYVVVGADMPETDVVTWTVPYHHFLAGTAKLRAQYLHLFADEPTLTMIDVCLGDGKLLGVWLNQDTGLLHGWAPWFQTHLPPSGAVLSLTKTDEPGQCTLLVGDKPDPQVYIGRETMERLLAIRERYSHKAASLRRLMGILLSDDRALGFNQLWAQLNVIRRTSRAQAASMLSFHHCFELGEGKRWYFRKQRLREGYRQDKMQYVVNLQQPGGKPAQAGK